MEVAVLWCSFLFSIILNFIFVSLLKFQVFWPVAYCIVGWLLSGFVGSAIYVLKGGLPPHWSYYIYGILAGPVTIYKSIRD